jgi:uncharacterized protein (DUF885 family)
MLARCVSGFLLLFPLLGVGLAVASQQEGPDLSPHARLHTLVESYYDEFLLLNPVLATFNGDHRYDNLFTIGISPDHRKRSLSLDREYLELARSLDRSSLDETDRLTLDIFIYSLEEAVEAFDYPDYLSPVNQFFSVPQVLPMMGAGESFQPFVTVKDYENWLQRLSGWGPWVQQAILNMRQGMEKGIVQPQIIVQRLLPLLAVHVVEDPAESVFYRPMEKIPAGIPEPERRRLEGLYKAAIQNDVVPHYRLLHEFMRDEYLPAARSTVGLSALPGGAQWYAFRVKSQTTTGLTPEEIHRIGLEEVKRLEGEIKRAARRTDLVDGRSVSSYSSEEEMLQGYRVLRQQVETRLPEFFRRIPAADFQVRAVESFRQATQAGASYMAAAPDGSRPGIFYVNTRNWRGAGPASEALFLHEAIPGHHFQISMQQELGELPRFRRHGRFTAYTEGWALYVESLGSGLGLYKTRGQYIGALRSELFRARRLVVDTGLHAMNWSREKAIDYIGSRNEVDRYIVLPGQALAYKVGQMRILELRAQAQGRLGERFDLRDFHDVILRGGALPLDLLEAGLETWIEEVAEPPSPEEP